MWVCDGIAKGKCHLFVTNLSIAWSGIILDMGSANEK